MIVLHRNLGCNVFGGDRTLNDIFLAGPVLTLVFIVDDGGFVLTCITGMS